MADDNQRSTQTRNLIIGTMAVLIAAISFSGKAVLAKLAYREGVDATTLLTLRMLMSLPFFLAMAVWGEWKSARRTTPRELGIIALIGLLGFYLAAITDFIGLQYISAGLERLVLYLYPTMVVLIAAFFLKRPITRTDMISLALCYVGVALAFSHEVLLYNGGMIWVGSALIATSAFTYAVYLVAGGELIKKVGGIRFTSYAIISSTIALMIHFTLTRPAAALVQPRTVYELTALMAFFSTVIPAFLMSEGLRRIGAGRTSIISSVGPVATIALAWWFLAEEVSAMQIAGTLLVIAGVLATSVKKETAVNS